MRAEHQCRGCLRPLTGKGVRLDPGDAVDTSLIKVGMGRRPAVQGRRSGWPKIGRQPALRPEVDCDLLAEVRLRQLDVGLDLLR